MIKSDIKKLLSVFYIDQKERETFFNSFYSSNDLIRLTWMCTQDNPDEYKETNRFTSFYILGHYPNFPDNKPEFLKMGYNDKK